MTIEKYLVLNKYLLSLFGMSEFRDLQEKLKDTQNGFDSDGRSHFVNVLRSLFENLKVQEFINNELQGDWKSHIVYINGQSILTPKDYEVRYIEPEFKKLMEG